MSNLQIQAPREPIGTDAEGRPVYMSHSWYRYFAVDLFARVGGTTSQTNTELAAAEYADAGIEELKLSLYRLRDELGMTEALIAEMRGQVAAMQSQIDGINSGVLL